MIPRTLTAGGGDPLPYPIPSLVFWPGAGRKLPGVGTQTLVLPQLFISAVVALLIVMDVALALAYQISSKSVNLNGGVMTSHPFINMSAAVI